jgi:hypothetical protein
MIRKATLVVLILVAAAAAKTFSIRGRIDRYLPPDIVTASGVKVALWQEDALKYSAVTGPDGMFYFVKVPGGTYRVEMTPPAGDDGVGPFGYKFATGDKRVLNLPAQMLNRFSFAQPAENAAVNEAGAIDAEGTHSYPSGTVIWFLFTYQGADAYRLLGDNVVLQAGSRWSARLEAPEKATGLVAVLATHKALDDFTAAGKKPTGFKKLPKSARIVATREFAKEE